MSKSKQKYLYITFEDSLAEYNIHESPQSDKGIFNVNIKLLPGAIHENGIVNLKVMRYLLYKLKIRAQFFKNKYPTAFEDPEAGEIRTSIRNEKKERIVYFTFSFGGIINNWNHNTDLDIYIINGLEINWLYYCPKILASLEEPGF